MSNGRLDTSLGGARVVRELESAVNQRMLKRNEYSVIQSIYHLWP